MAEFFCEKCANSGQRANGEPCDCGAQGVELIVPPHISIPLQYQTVKYNKIFVRQELQGTLGVFMENLLKEITQNLHAYCKNYVICAPANSGKTVWTYNLYSILYSKGEDVPELMDLMQVRDTVVNYYNEDTALLNRINNSKIMVVRIPMDLPNKFVETMSTIVDRRVRNNCSTIFLYNGTRNDLYAQDRFEKLRFLEGDGSYNTVCIKSFEVRR